MKRNVLLGLAASLALIPAALMAQEAPKKSTAPVLCIVKGDEIADPTKAAGKYEANGKTYYICCAGCKAKFDKATPSDRAKMVKVTDLRTEKIVLQKRLNAVDSQLKTLTASEAKPAVATATSATKVYCAMTDEEIGAAADAGGGKSAFGGKTYYFCCPSCKKKFDTAPAKFAAEADKRNAARKN